MGLRLSLPPFCTETPSGFQHIVNDSKNPLGSWTNNMSDTFRNLAATAANSLELASDSPVPFTRAYARKSIFEAVLRLYKVQAQTAEPRTDMEALIQELKGQFGV